MKKTLCMILALVALTVALCLPASAASDSNAVVIDATGKVFKMNFKTVSSATEQNIINKVPDSDKLGYNAGQEESSQLVLEGLVEGDWTGVVFPVKVRISFSGITPGTKFKIMSFIDENNYIILDAVVGQGSALAGTDAAYYSPSLDFTGTWLEIIFENEAALSGYFLFNSVKPIKSPQTGVDGTAWFATLLASFALLSVAGHFAVKSLKKKTNV